MVTLSSHHEPEARGSSWEEPPTPEARARSREEQPEEPWLRRRRRAERSYPTLKVRRVAVRRYPATEPSGGQEKTPRVLGQGQPGEVTLHPRPGVVTLRSHPKPEARAGSWEEQPMEWWLRRHRRA